MSNVIEELYYGNLEPQEMTTEISPILESKLSTLVKKEEELMSILPENEKDLFSDYVCAYLEFSSLSNSDSFISGFRLGARFTYDTFVSKPKG